ncbi:hypothetical protein SODALDRAFT_363376 [Sodiomyces alkalinus F11]|uniref:Uncharacterized protein n=1 Tax=Sodiomyces alkalinus (strain CBS 110278 / VKM F-3762 / F11) TaxID=1314773 RepID=A0A3N2PLX1_SODAK|nr:hypothetical protein SODALDRAFT_363376 [Sodiomyces alkalinus F11]ROT35535.1 hypothetical protein SODALDRAFT_363376 [Sodiomyces alkalinus F11]
MGQWAKLGFRWVHSPKTTARVRPNCGEMKNLVYLASSRSAPGPKDRLPRMGAQKLFIVAHETDQEAALDHIRTCFSIEAWWFPFDFWVSMERTGRTFKGRTADWPTEIPEVGQVSGSFWVVRLQTTMSPSLVAFSLPDGKRFAEKPPDSLASADLVYLSYYSEGEAGTFAERSKEN